MEQAPCPPGSLRPKAFCEHGRIVRVDPDGTTRSLTDSFHSACEFDVSFDAKRILFPAKRREGDPWAIWEMSSDGSNTRQVTRVAGNCRTPAYQSTFYTIVSNEPWYQIMFSSDLAGEMNELGTGPSFSLYSCHLDGEHVRRLTMNPNDDLDPYLMPDGRVLLTSWRRVDDRHGLRGRASLFGLNTDGTDYALFLGDPGRSYKLMPCIVGDERAVFVEADRLAWGGAGQLASVSLRRSFYSYRPITADRTRVYHSPSPLPDGTILVSSQSAQEAAPFAIYRLDVHTGNSTRVLTDPLHHSLYAMVLAPRVEPDGRSSVVDERRQTGKLYCLNAYISDSKIMSHLTPGTVKRVRVLEGVPLPTPTDGGIERRASHAGHRDGNLMAKRRFVSTIGRRLLGVVDVCTDGSFQVEVPADVPIQLQTLDEHGMALASCGWIWVKHREPRGCIGCHEDPELTPENRLVDAMRRPAAKLTLPESKRRTVTFSRDVMPIISAKCNGCHTSDATGIDLSNKGVGEFNRAYKNLLFPRSASNKAGEIANGRHVHPGRARTSPLVWRLWGKNTARPWDSEAYSLEWSAKCPPPSAVPLTDDEKLIFVEWMDFGAPWNDARGEGSLNILPANSKVE